MCRFAGAGITPRVFNIGLITVIYRLAFRAHLPPEAQHNPDQERASHDLRRGQRGQIREHAGLQTGQGTFCWLLLLALWLMAVRCRARPPARSGRPPAAES